MKSLVVFAFFALASSANANLMLEPYAGYYLGTETTTVRATGVDGKSTSDAAAFGARLAFEKMGLWGGLDYMYAPDHNVKYTLPSGLRDTTATRSILFIAAGYDFPIVRLRVFGGYGVLDEWRGSTNATHTGTYSGTAIKGGIGFKPIPLLAINLEYIKHNFTKYKSFNGREVDIGQSYSNFNASGWFLTASLPLVF
jgi:hypothetical protein